MRGRTLKNSFAILDEAQNATETQIKMFLTRIGENSKLVVNGDPSQIDLINKSYSGLIKSKKILKNIKEIKIIEFDHLRCCKTPWFQKIIRAYQKKALMLKINVISNNLGWNNLLSNPNTYIEKKVTNLNKKNKNFKKILYIAPYFYLEIWRLKNLIKNLEIRINQQMCYHFLFTIRKTFKKN